jgi:hypothetical protein
MGFAYVYLYGISLKTSQSARGEGERKGRRMCFAKYRLLEASEGCKKGG